MRRLPQQSWEDEGAIWRPSQRGGILDHLALRGLSATDIDALIATHLHFDHFGNAPLFPNAEIYISGRGLEYAARAGRWTVASRYPYDTIQWVLENRADKLHRASSDETEIASGVAVRLVGGSYTLLPRCHSQDRCRAAGTRGDIFPLFDNIDDDLPTGNYHNLDELLRAMRDLREWGTVLPSHDPRVVGRSFS